MSGAEQLLTDGIKILNRILITVESFVSVGANFRKL